MSSDLVKMKMVFTNDDMNRIIESDDGYVVDLHGKHRHEAKVFINNIITLVNHPFNMVLIHGYNRGTVLKEMIFEETINSRIISRKGSSINMGQTFVCVA